MAMNRTFCRVGAAGAGLAHQSSVVESASNRITICFSELSLMRMSLSMRPATRFSQNNSSGQQPEQTTHDPEGKRAGPEQQQAEAGAADKGQRPNQSQSAQRASGLAPNS